ncbi:MAG: type II secretion system protein GspK [Gemmataceae bacterium]
MIAQTTLTVSRDGQAHCTMPTGRECSRPGYVLIAVLLVVVVLSYASYRYLDAMTEEKIRSYRSTEQVQVRLHAISGIHYAMGALSDPDTMTNTLNNVYTDNSAFQNQIAGDGTGPRGGGRFALPNVTNVGNGQYSTTYGASDESGKININALILSDPTGNVLHNALMLLPNMTEEIADAIVDWLDVDDTPRASGAESSEYTNYSPKNGPINTLDELLLVRGVTAQLLYGTDFNRNGVADSYESQFGDFSRGWSDYITCYGREPNIDLSGAQRIDLTNSTLTDLYDQLTPVSQELADYVLAYRMFGSSPVGSNSSSSGGSTTTTKVTTVTVGQNGSTTMVVTSGPSNNNQSSQTMTASAEQLTAAVQLALSTGTASSKQKPKSYYDLVNTQVTLPKAPGQPANAPTYVYPSPLNKPANLNQLLPTLLDKTTTTPGTELIPRVNINTAPYEVLMAVPGMTEDMANNIIASRTGLDPTDPATTTGAWLVTTLNMPVAVFNQMTKYITGRTQLYRVQSLGYFNNGGPTARFEAIIDTNQGTPRIVYFRDLTDLGRGFSPPR